MCVEIPMLVVTGECSPVRELWVGRSLRLGGLMQAGQYTRGLSAPLHLALHAYEF